VNLGNVKERVRDSLGAISGEIDTQVLNFIDDAIRDIHGAGRWPWDLDSGTFTSRADIVGTTTWTKGATTTVLDTGNVASQALADEYVGGLIKLAGANVYEVTAYVQSTSTLTLDSEIIDASGTASAFQFIQDKVTLGSDVESVIDVVDYLFPQVLGKRDGHTRQRLWPDPFVVIGGIPGEWWARGVDASGNVEIILYPPPDEDRAYAIEYWRRPRFTATDGDEMEAATGIPERFHPVIVAGAKYRAYEFEFEQDSVKAMAFGEFQRGLDNMRQFGRHNAGVARRLGSDRRRSRNPFGRQDSYWPTDRITGV